MSLYNFAMSNPRSDVRNINDSFRLVSIDDMNKAPWMRPFDYVSGVIKDLLKKIEEAIDICNDADGPSAFPCRHWLVTTR